MNPIPPLKKILALLTPRERRRGALMLGMMIIMAILEVVGVASIMPFLTVLGNPETVHTNPLLSRAHAWTGSPPLPTFLFALGALATVVVVAGAAFRGLTHYAMARFVNMRRHSIACKLLNNYVRQPYEFFLNRNSADLSKSVLSEVEQVIGNVIKPGIQLIAYSLVSILVLAMLVAVNVKVALLLTLIMGGAYAAIYFTVSRLLTRIGTDRVIANKERFTAAGETFGGIKDIKLLGHEEAYLKRFAPSSRRFARHQVTNQVLGQVPKFAVEGVAFGAMMGVALFLLSTRGGDVSQVVPILGVYAFAGYRLMPALQKVYRNLAQLRFGMPALDALYQDLTSKENEQPGSGNASAAQPVALNQSLNLQDITYTYPGATVPAIKNLNLTIPAHSTVGFVGATGAGKTTLIDIILGLLPPEQGRILVDGREIIGPHVRAWQKSLGYVPQHIYLSDESVTANIAFGVPKDQIDVQAVQHAAKIAALHEFIVEELPDGYDTVVGERGVRLSGGQRQRIGIARALYHDPGVLVLDEATSALDNATERSVMESIESLKGNRTIIMIAHRLSTVKGCDQIHVLEYGRLIAQGKYFELIDASQQFRRMAAVNQ